MLFMWYVSGIINERHISCITFFWFWQQIPVHTACRFLMKADTPTFWSLIIWQIFTNCIYHITISSRYLHQLWTYFLCIFKSVTHYFSFVTIFLCLLVINLLAETNSSCRLYFYLQQLCFVFTGDKLSNLLQPIFLRNPMWITLKINL